MPRNVTITFGDGSSHIYNNVPDNVTPEQATARANKDFPGKQITHLDGGRGGGGQPQQAQRPTGTPEGSPGDPFGALERRVQQQQQSAAPVQGALGIAARSFGRGYQEGTPSDMPMSPQQKQQWLQTNDDPTVDNRAGWAKRLGIDFRPPLQTAAEKQKAQADAEAQAKQDKEQGGFWLSTLPEFAGSMAGGGPGAAAKIGGAARGVGRLLEPVTNALTESRAGRALGIGAGERGTVPFAEGSLAEARAKDAALGTAGMRDRWYSGLARPIERVSAEIPGGGSIRRATTEAATRSAELQTDQIANNLARGQEQVISTERGAYGALNNADRAQVAAFWRVGGPDHVFQALTRSGQDPQLLRLIQQTTSVLTPGSRRYIASEMISRMSRNPNGAFSVDAFFRNWQQMAPAARDAVFGAGAIPADYARNMSELAANIERIQAYSTSTATSRLRGMVAHRGLAGLAAAAGVAGGAVAVGVEAILHGLLAPKLAAGAIALGSSNYVLSQALTNPSTVKWLAAQSAKMVALHEAESNSQFSEMSTSPTVH